MFYFVNAYISFFIYAFWDKDFMLLAKNLATILLMSQFISSIISFLLGRVYIRWNMNKIQEHFFDLKDPRIEDKKSRVE
jgi:hypothetical protein